VTWIYVLIAVTANLIDVTVPILLSKSTFKNSTKHSKSSKNQEKM